MDRMQICGLLVMTLVLAWWHDPVLNLAVFLMSVILILLSGTRVRSLFPLRRIRITLIRNTARFSTGSCHQASTSVITRSPANLHAIH